MSRGHARCGSCGVFVSCRSDTELAEFHLDFTGKPDLVDRRSVLRTPVVLRCVEDFVAGKRLSDAVFTGMLPLQQNVHRILATADLV